MRQFLEVESAHYPEMDTLVASEGQSRLDLYLDGKVVDTIHIYRWTMAEVRELLADLGLKRDESITYEKKAAEMELAKAFMDPTKGLKNEL